MVEEEKILGRPLNWDLIEARGRAMDCDRQKVSQ